MPYAYATIDFMGTMTIRLNDRTQAELTTIARAQGISLSELARGTLMSLLVNDDVDEERSGQAPVPPQLTTVERAQLALMHRILGHLVDGDDEEGDRENQVKLAETLEQGYRADYDDVFLSINAELSRQETSFVLGVLDMFEVLERSFAKLPSGDQARVGEHAPITLVFRGFDANSRREGRLLTYAQRLIADGKWEKLADRFDRANDRGNSHYPMVERYERMLAEFTPIWSAKVRDAAVGGGRKGGYDLSAEQLAAVARASVHPSKR